VFTHGKNRRVDHGSTELAEVRIDRNPGGRSPAMEKTPHGQSVSVIKT
jgi:hypothetical protein